MSRTSMSLTKISSRLLWSVLLAVSHLNTWSSRHTRLRCRRANTRSRSGFCPVAHAEFSRIVRVKNFERVYFCSNATGLT